MMRAGLAHRLALLPPGFLLLRSHRRCPGRDLERSELLPLSCCAPPFSALREVAPSLERRSGCLKLSGGGEESLGESCELRELSIVPAQKRRDGVN